MATSNKRGRESRTTTPPAQTTAKKSPKNSTAKKSTAKKSTTTKSSARTSPAKTRSDSAVNASSETSRGQRRRAKSKLPAGWVERLIVEPVVDGPRQTLGVLWFALAIGAVIIGPTVVAGLFGFVAMIAALQSAQAWRNAGVRGSRIVAVIAAGAMPVSALVNPAAPGIVLLAMVPAAALFAAVRPKRGRRSRSVAMLVSVATTICCTVPAGLAATGMVFVSRTNTAAAIELILLVSAYDIGWFWIGSEGVGPSVGILAGQIATIVVVTPIFAFQLTPFDGTPAAWVFGGMVATLAPLGQVIVSGALPSARSWVPAARRLDAYVLVGLVWTWMLWPYLS